MGAVGEAQGLIGNVNTVVVGPEASIRDVTIECRDAAHAADVSKRMGALEGVKVIWYRDRALIRHEGGKLNIEPAVTVETVQDVRDIYTPGVARACLAIAEDRPKPRA
jgi:malate dehydrogenase (oxaloacetate-decarboxylating)